MHFCEVLQTPGEDLTISLAFCSMHFCEVLRQNCTGRIIMKQFTEMHGYISCLRLDCR